MRTLILFIVLLMALPARAADTPMPGLHPVQEAEQELVQEKQRQRAIEKQVKEAQSSLNSTKQKLIRLADKVKDAEQELNRLDRQMLEKQTEIDSIQERLEKDKGSIGGLVLALARMRRIPPEATLARPGAPLETAQGALILHSMLPAIYGRAEGLKQDVERLQTLLAELETNREKAQRTKKNLEGEQKSLASLLISREKLFKQTSRDYKAQELEVSRLSTQASSLRDLVQKLHAKNEANNHAAATYQRASAAAPLPKVGNARLPVAGVVRVGFGQKDDIGATSQGWHIDSREDALVVAPMGGIVRYAGNFRNYGQIVIIEHKKGYHSLIAGLGKIDTVVGQSVEAGEPVAHMGRSLSAAPSLYYELRQNGRPVNPSRVLSGQS